MMRLEAWNDKGFLRVGLALEMIGFSESLSFPEQSISGGKISIWLTKPKDRETVLNG
jgi:hypothetical protein